MLAKGVEMHLSRGSQQWILAQDHDAFFALPREALEANTEVDFLTREKFSAEAADFAKGRGFAKDE